MRIERDRVGALNARQRLFPALRDHRCRAGTHHPRAAKVFRAHIRPPAHRADRTAPVFVVPARSRLTQNGSLARRRTIRRDRRFERGNRKPQPIVSRDGAFLLRPKSQNAKPPFAIDECVWSEQYTIASSHSGPPRRASRAAAIAFERFAIEPPLTRRSRRLLSPENQPVRSASQSR